MARPRRPMLSKILGIISIVLGLLWLIKPQALKNRLSKKMSRRLKLIVYIFIIIFGFGIITSIAKAQGILPKIAAILGIVVTVKFILFITSKTSEKISDFLKSKPLYYFRIWALIILIIGVMMILQ